jgi:hypothetical protein
MALCVFACGREGVQRMLCYRQEDGYKQPPCRRQHAARTGVWTADRCSAGHSPLSLWLTRLGNTRWSPTGRVPARAEGARVSTCTIHTHVAGSR